MLRAEKIIENLLPGMEETAVDVKPNYNKVVIVGVATIVILLIVGIVFLVVGKPSPVSPLAEEDGVRIIFVSPEPSPSIDTSPEASASATPAASAKATPKATSKATPKASASPSASSQPSATPKASASPSASPS